MTIIGLNLRPGGIIPPALTVGLMLRKVAPVVVIDNTVAPVAEEVAVLLPAGTDRWYDAPNRSVIPFKSYNGQMCEDTPNIGLGFDDDAQFEGDIPGLSPTPCASAWWQLTVPTSISGCQLTVDTWESRGGLQNGSGSGSPTYHTDTNITVWGTAEAPPLGSLPTADTDFETLVAHGQADDSPQPPGVDFPFLTKLSASLTPGVYWVRVDTWGGESDPGTNYHDGMIYRLRVSLTPF